MGDFEKARDSLIQEISGSINSIVINLNTLNRSLNNSIQVGKEFDHVSNLWNNFYTGIKEPSKQNDENVVEEAESPTSQGHDSATSDNEPENTNPASDSQQN